MASRLPKIDIVVVSIVFHYHQTCDVGCVLLVKFDIFNSTHPCASCAVNRREVCRRELVALTAEEIQARGFLSCTCM